MGEGSIEDRELRDIMTRYQCGDLAALDELVRQISPPLLRYFSGPRLGRDEAEDLLQDCWIRIHRARHTYRNSEPVMPWIYAIARYTRLDAYRKRRRMESKEIPMGEIPEHLHRAAPEVMPEKNSLDRLISGLPDSQREVILMLKVAGMSLEEVARATSSTVGAVKQKAHRAYTAIRRKIEKDIGHEQ